jgi:glycosyltransferase involved in cell wall biosynthesis
VPAGRPGPPALGGLEGRPYVVTLGTREPRKNLPRLVLAFAAVHARHPELALVLVGGAGDDDAAIEAAIAALPPAARGRVIMTGWLGDDERTQVLAGASVLAYPSLDEGFGFPVLEAMQLGVPVVAARAGAIPEVAGDAAVLVDPLDAAALAGAVVDVLEDRRHREQLIAAGHARVGGFDWERQASSLVALYRDALERAA